MIRFRAQSRGNSVIPAGTRPGHLVWLAPQLINRALPTFVRVYLQTAWRLSARTDIVVTCVDKLQKPSDCIEVQLFVTGTQHPCHIHRRH
jgi:hypothetical protein